jgi:hypothetical protein
MGCHARNEPKNKGSEQNDNRNNGNNRETDQGKITTANHIVAIARAACEAYVAKNRAAIEKLIAADFHFTSPLDNRIVCQEIDVLRWIRSINLQQKCNRAFFVGNSATRDWRGTAEPLSRWL